MSRKLLLEDGLPRRVILCDSYDLATSTPSGTIHTLYLDDAEPHPKTLAEVHALLVKDKIIDKGVGKTVAALSAALGTATVASKATRVNP